MATYPGLGEQAWSIDGTPSDCVNIALGHLLPKKPDVVLSGLNIGFNATMPLCLSSGTLAGATEGTAWGLPAVACSLDLEQSLFEQVHRNSAVCPPALRPHLETACRHAARFAKAGFRAVPNCVVRKSAYIAPGAILMPSFVNLGAYVDTGTMVDTWVTVGSCAQIGKNVHLSGGVGIGGVLEPMQAGPTIIEDNCFIGARSEVVEGVVIEEHSVLGMGVYIGQSTPIFDRATGEISYGRVPSGSVVVSGNIPKTAANGAPYSMYAAIIVKRVDAQTRSKTSINDLLRD